MLYKGFSLEFCPFLHGRRLLRIWSPYSFLTLHQMKELFFLPSSSHIGSKTGSSRVVFLTTLGSWFTGKKDLYRVSVFYSDRLLFLICIAKEGFSSLLLCFQSLYGTWWRLLEKNLWIHVEQPMTECRPLFVFSYWGFSTLMSAQTLAMC